METCALKTTDLAGQSYKGPGTKTILVETRSLFTGKL